MSLKPKIIRATTVPMSLEAFCKGMLRELSEKYEVVALSSPDPELEIVREREGVRTIAVRMERHISLVADVKALWRLWRVFRRERPQMVHSMTPKAGMLCMVAAWLARVPVRVHTFTGLVFPTAVGLKRKILMATDWLTCACATHVIPEGEGVKRDLLTNHITKKPLEVLGYGSCKGIDLLHYDRTPEVMAEAEKLRRPKLTTFVFIGRLVGDKGINELVSAFVRLHQQAPMTRLVLVGREERELDPLRPETLRAMKACEGIVCPGSQGDVRPWLAMADVAVLPSYREGFPNVVLEAGALGLPQIVTDINGAREIIVEGENGTIVPSKDADALYGAMARMMDADGRATLAEHARRMIAERYDEKYVRQCLYAFYDRVMG